jgi:hypothetical protein
MPKPPHFVVAPFFNRASRYRVDCKLCNYGQTCTLQACARHIFSKCSKATPQHQQELLDLLSSSNDLDVLQPHAVAAFQAAQVQLLQRQQAWREQQEQQLANGELQAPTLQEFATALQQAVADSGDDDSAARPQKRPRTPAERARHGQQQQQQQQAARTGDGEQQVAAATTSAQARRRRSRRADRQHAGASLQQAVCAVRAAERRLRAQSTC